MESDGGHAFMNELGAYGQLEGRACWRRVSWQLEEQTGVQKP